MSRYRHDQGENYFTQHTDTPGLGHTSHFRTGPVKPEDVFKPLPVCLPEQAHQNSRYEEICGIDPIEPTASHHVPDAGGTGALLGLTLLLVLCLARRSHS